MKKKVKISLLIALTIIVALIMVKQSLSLHSEIKKIKFPTKETRALGNMSTYKWLSVKKLSKRLNISEESIFKALDIVPEKGDENIPIKELAQKHNKTLEEIRSNLRKLIANHHKNTGEEIYE